MIVFCIVGYTKTSTIYMIHIQAQWNNLVRLYVKIYEDMRSLVHRYLLHRLKGVWRLLF